MLYICIRVFTIESRKLSYSWNCINTKTSKNWRLTDRCGSIFGITLCSNPFENETLYTLHKALLDWYHTRYFDSNNSAVPVAHGWVAAGARNRQNPPFNCLCRVDVSSSIAQARQMDIALPVLYRIRRIDWVASALCKPLRRMAGYGGKYGRCGLRFDYCRAGK